MKRIRLFFFMLMIAVGACNMANGQKDLALNRPYTLSVPPNYQNTAPGDDRTVLTNGVFTSGYFWANKQTAGWIKVNKVAIEIDLGKSVDFNQVTFNTGRREVAQAYYPTNVFVFVSDDKSSYQYIGDVVASPDNVSGDYKVQNFILKTGTVHARYVKLVAIVQGVLLFCDEIQVFNTGGSAPAKMAFSKIPVDDQVDDLLNKDASGKAVAARGMQYQAAMGPVGKTGRVASGADFAMQLKQQLGTDFTVNFFNAWDGLNAVYKPVKRSSDNVTVRTVINGHSYVGFIVTNLSQRKANYTIDAKSDQRTGALVIYTAPFLTSHMNYQQTADPLQVADEQLNLDPGESRLFLAEMTGKGVGNGKNTITVSDGKTSQTVTVSLSVANIRFDESKFALNTSVWAYLNYPMLSTRKTAAVKDLYEHHINTAAIPAAALGDLAHTSGSNLSQYLSAFGNYKPRTLLLNINFLSQENLGYCKKNDFMSDDWKADFKTWFQNLSKIITQSGWNMQNVYLYPYDEIAEENADKLLAFAKWAKSAIPGVKLYMTVGKLSKDKIGQLSQYMDIMQIHEDVMPAVTPVADKYWMYATKGNAELLSPYSYYRLMSWKAFSNGYTGVGFWAYADSKDPSFNNILKTRYFAASTNYAAVYVDGNNIVSSRRWEGFMMGVEDYELLQLYAKKVGAAKAKALAMSVAGTPGDASLADAARDKIITALSE
ncbi:discoidin domain-containing protein [Chitinophaga sancti]|uniref:discoidin domain-containing protein n=1 Tax=Chitinophaga sancti TaxID=1004 RepID=UPI003F7A7AA9